MAVLTRQQIDAASDIRTETVEVPEWGGSVIVRGITARERDEWEAESMPSEGSETPNLVNMRARLCVRVIVDEAGKRLYDPDEADELGKRSSAALSRVYEVARRLGGIGNDAIEERAKN